MLNFEIRVEIDLAWDRRMCRVGTKEAHCKQKDKTGGLEMLQATCMIEIRGSGRSASGEWAGSI